MNFHPPAIEIRSLRVDYGDFLAVDDLSLSVPRGEVFGLVGPNGAGKTSTFRVLTTLMEPTYGEVLLDGVDVLEDLETARRIIGYMPDLAAIITPSIDHQRRGWRRVRKLGLPALPRFSDEATASGFVLVMALAGAIGWFVFTRALVESRWFPGQVVSLGTLGYFIAVMTACGLGFQALLETKGGRSVGLAALLVGVVPVMAGAVLSAISDRMISFAVWLTGMSPASMPFYAPGSLLSISELPAEAARAVPRAFYFWLFVGVLLTGWLIVRLRQARRAMAASVAKNP